MVSRKKQNEFIKQHHFNHRSRFGHWACGWFELILVNPASDKHLKIAYQIKQDLDAYPVLDDDDYSEREYESHADYATAAKTQLTEALSIHFNVKHTNMLENIAFELNMADQSENGIDSCINIYSSRKPDHLDMKSLINAMKSIEHNYKNSKVFKALSNSVKV